jgi:DNA-binding NarL/FixJ family response regulator
MNYIFYNHYYIGPMTPSPNTKIILLAEPELESRALYYKHLSSDPEVTVSICEEPSKLLELLSSLEPDLLIINPGENPARSLVFLQSIKKVQPSLRIITVGYGTPDNYLDRFMQLGVSYHINRHLSRPQDILAAAQQVLADVYSLNI